MRRATNRRPLFSEVRVVQVDVEPLLVLHVPRSHEIIYNMRLMAAAAAALFSSFQVHTAPYCSGVCSLIYCP